MTALASAEHIVPSDKGIGYDQAIWGGNAHQRKALVNLWEALVLEDLAPVEVEYPHIPWVHSVRGLLPLFGPLGL